MDRARRDERVDAEVVRHAERLAAGVDVFGHRTREPAGRRGLEPLRDHPDRFEVTVGRDRETRFDDVHPEVFQRQRDVKLLFGGEASR